ncbi:MAG: NH(3)-dependent synthetase [Pedosphaera sp.]|nr:NH(3)-dependent synthetase [Pedosphaera sp.]
MEIEAQIQEFLAQTFLCNDHGFEYGGDSGVDIKAIGHLFKTQIYQLGRHLGTPEEIQKRTPTSYTYSAHCTQEEFFFRLPFPTMDLLWYAQEQQVPPREAAEVMGLIGKQVERAFDDFTRKDRTTEYLRMAPQGIDER